MWRALRSLSRGLYDYIIHRAYALGSTLWDFAAFSGESSGKEVESDKEAEIMCWPMGLGGSHPEFYSEGF